MKLSLNQLESSERWQDNNIALPQYDIVALRGKTYNDPEWIHFGGGNIFRVFIAAALQDAIEDGRVDTGIIVAESYDYEIIDKYYKAYDNLSLSVIMDAEGNYHKRIIASITEALKGINGSDDYKRLETIVSKKSLKMISFTITEKGYAIRDINGDYLKVIENGPDNPKHTMSITASLLHKRYQNGAYPIAIVSMDNCSHNGDKVGNAIKEIAQKWQEKGLVEQGFIDYLNDKTKVSFPYTMIDKITPRPAESVKKHLESIGLEDMDLIVTDKGLSTAPFVNSEVCEYLIIEDHFPNGRIDISSDRVIFTDRNTVNNVETMKVTTCLNPLHTALAVTGCLLGYTLIANQMKDSTMVKLIKKIGYDEGLKVVVDPKIINPKTFIDEVVNERLVNPNIPDTPQRIAMDTSQKVAIRFGETIKSYRDSSDLEPSALIGIPLALAAWCRYLVGIDDGGNTFEISSDPLMNELRMVFGELKIGESKDISDFLKNEKIFGVNLYDIGLGEKVQDYFDQMLSKVRGVKDTLDMYL